MDHLLGLILLTLGLTKPATFPTVKGDAIENQQSATPSSHVREKEKDRETSKAANLSDRPRVIKDHEREKDRPAKNLSETVKTLQEKAHLEHLEKHEEFRQKLQTIDDEKKKTILTNFDKKLTEVNTRRTAKMTESLTKLTTVTEKIASRTAQAKNEGKDTAAVETSLMQAQETLTAAQACVTTQAGKEYIVTISSEDTLKTEAGQTAKTLTADIKTCYDQILSAKKALETTVKTLKGIL